MGSDLNITKQFQDYILRHGLKLHPIQKEIIRDRNKIMCWVPTFHIFIPEADSKDLNLVNLSAIYNFDDAYIEKIKNNAWLESMGGNISKEIH